MYKTIISIIDVFMVVTPNSARKHSETMASFLEHTHCTQRLHTDERITNLLISKHRQRHSFTGTITLAITTPQTFNYVSNVCRRLRSSRSPGDKAQLFNDIDRQ